MTDIAPVMPEVNFGTDPVEDLYERMEQLHAEGRKVVPVRYIDGIAWLILKYDNVSEVFSDDVTLPSAPGYERISMPSTKKRPITTSTMAAPKTRKCGSKPSTEARLVVWPAKFSFATMKASWLWSTFA